MKFPTKLGACVDMAYTLRAERLEIEKKAEAVKAKESALKDHIIATFSKAEIEGAKGKVASASMSIATKASVKDWPTVQKWIEDNDAWDLMIKSINNKAYRDRLNAGVQIPGVEPFTEKVLSLTKIGG